MEIARNKLSKLDFEQFGKFNDKIKRDVALENTSALVFGFYQDYIEFNKKLKEKQLRYNYHSPIQYIDFLNQIKIWYERFKQKCIDDFEFHESGVKKFKEISDSVVQEEKLMRVKNEELTKKRIELENKEKELKEKSEEINKLTEKCESKEKELESVRIEVSEEKKIIEEKVKIIKEELDKAAEQVNSISNNDIATLKSTVLIPKHFPKVEPVLKSFIALCTNKILSDSNEIKKQFSTSTLIKSYIEADININDNIIIESRNLLSSVKADEIKRLSSTV